MKNRLKPVRPGSFGGKYHKMVLDEFYRVAFCKKIYRSLEELQEGLEDCLDSLGVSAPRCSTSTTKEADRHLQEPAFPRLVGVAEVCEMLSVTRQRLVMLRGRHDFPAPVAELAAGPVWRAGDLSTFVDNWGRKPRRLRKEVALGDGKAGRSRPRGTTAPSSVTKRRAIRSGK